MGKLFTMTGFFKWPSGSWTRCFAATSGKIQRQSLLLLLCLLGWASTAQAVITASERAVHAAIYASTNGAGNQTKGSIPSQPGIPLFVGSASFGNVALGATAQRGYSITPSGGPVNYDSLTYSSNSPDFVLSKGTCQGVIQVGTVCTLQIFFTPTALGARSGILNITGPSYTTDTLNVDGVGIMPPPAITSVSPLSGVAGTIVTITGTSLTGASVTIGGAAATIITISATQITTVVPVSATVGAGNIVVTTGGGVAASPFTVTPPPPTCTLIATPAAIVLGSSSSLTTSCSPTATSFVWTGGTCAGTTGANCTVTPSTVGITTYTVRGINAGGAGNIASAAVTVTPPPALFCTLTATPASISIGGTSTLMSSCTIPATFFSWTGGTCAGTTAASCVVTPSATTTYTMTAGTASATYTASATVTVTPAATAPVCNLIVSPAAIAAGRTSTLTASCSPSATAYSWTGGSCAGTIGGTCVVTPTVTTAYTVRGSNANGIGNTANGTVTIVVPVFPVTVTGTITSTVANITANIQFRPQDVGTPATGNVYVFALAPASLVKNIPIGTLSDHKGPVTRSISTADSPQACVLARLLNGELTYVESVGSLPAFLTGVLGSLGASVSVLNGVRTEKIGGAIFYVGYGVDPKTMILNGTNQNVVEVTGSVVCQPEHPQTGWWWYPLQDGRGFGIEVRGNTMFMSGYLYDSTGHATWIVSSGPVALDGSLYNGKLYHVSNGQTLTGAYKAPAPVTMDGDITLAFANSRNGTLTWPGGIIPLVRFDDVIGAGKGVTPAFVPENGWWWNEAESGRGFFMEFKNNFAFIAGYMYEADGRPVWYTAQKAMTTPQTFSSNWLQIANGQTMTGPYKVPVIINSNVGPVTIVFQDAANALLTLPTGRQVAITRHRF